MKRLSIKWACIIAALIAITSLHSLSAQEQKEKKVEIKKTITDEDTSIHVKIEKEDGSIFEKTYSSQEEMENDPELKEMNVVFGHEDGNIMRSGDHQDRNLELIIEGEGGEKIQKVIMIKSGEGNLHESQEGENVWIEKLDGEETEHNFLMKTSEGNTYKIQKDADGELQIEKNGELVEIEELEEDEKINVKEDGTIIITDGDEVSEIKMNGDGESMVFMGDGEGHKMHKIENGQGMVIFKSEDGEEMEIDITEDFEWEGDNTGNVFIMKKENGEVVEVTELDGGNFAVTVDVETEVDEEGNQKIIIHKKVEKFQIEIIEANLEEISEIPGVHLNDGRGLELEEVDYYPNPSEGQFTLKFRGEKMPTEIKIIDLMGKEVYEEHISEFNGFYDKQIDLSTNEAGVYILQVIQNNRSWSKKVVVE